MKFECACCNYSSNDTGNYGRHLLSKRHLANQNKLDKNKKENDAKNNICIYCRKYIPSDKIMTHYWEDCNIITKLENDIGEFKQEIIRLSTENSRLTNELIVALQKSNDKYADDNTTLLETNKNLSTAECNAMTFLSKTFTKTPALQCITQDRAHELITFSKTTDDIDMNSKDLEELSEEEVNNKINDLCVEQLIFEYKNNKLHKYITNIVKDEYITKNPKDQQIWNTDKARLSYIVREVMNTKNEWIRDSKGTKIKEYILTPLLSVVEDMIIAYLGRTRKLIRDDKYAGHVSKINLMQRSHDATSILNSINTNVLNDKIVTEMASYFGIANAKKQTIK
jgi:hypothetical protein